MKYAISIEGLSVSYDRKRVLSHIFLSLEAGHVYGLIGPNGAGKSTLFKAILGLSEGNTTGEVRIHGRPVEEQRKEMVYLPQKSDIDWSFPATVYDVALMGRYPHKRVFERLTADDHAKAMAALQELGIESLRDRQIGALSGGQQQRVFLARALCQEADIWLLDEPFVGVDVTTEEKIIQLLQTLAHQRQTLLVVHNALPTVANHFDRIILLNHRPVAFGATKEIFTEENIRKTYGGQLPILHQTGMIG